jgi:DNA-binding YbaB/EbfC family protein
MKGAFGDMMKQAQKMQADLQKAQEEMADLEVVGEAGAGMVQVVMTGRHDVRRVSIDPAVLQEDKEILEDLLAAAVNDANRKVDQTLQDRFSGMLGGLGLPPGMKLPF